MIMEEIKNLLKKLVYNKYIIKVKEYQIKILI